jgi:hypothetical protein
MLDEVCAVAIGREARGRLAGLVVTVMSVVGNGVSDCMVVRFSSS